MNYLPPSFYGYQEEKKPDEKKEKEKGLKALTLIPVKQSTFIDLATFSGKITLYKHDLVVGYGVEGGIKRLHVFIKEGKLLIRYTYKDEDPEKEENKKKPEFEYMVFIKKDVYLILRNEKDDLEVFKVGGTAQIAIYVEAISPVNGNVIYGCHMSDRELEDYGEGFTMNEKTGAMLMYSFKAFINDNVEE